MTELFAVLGGAFLGSAHCIGMCGPLAAALGAQKGPKPSSETGRSLLQAFAGPGRDLLGRQVVYTLGRLCTYSFLGAVGGFAGLYLSQFQTSLVSAQRVFSTLAGGVMIYVGLSLLGLIPFRRKVTGAGGGLFAGLFAHFLNARGWFGHFAAGLATGFLPCGLVYAFLAMAVATGNVLQGMAVMACFGLGTAPAMMAVGCGGRLLSNATRLKALRIAACLVVLMGGMMIYRSIPGGGPAHCPEVPISPLETD
jgi:hypothetical protein